MFDSMIPLNAFNRSYLSRLMQEIDDSELDATFGPESHSARWILAHLAIAVDYGFMQLETPFAASKLWHKTYGPGSEPASNKDVRPSKAELMSFIEVNYGKLCQSALLGDAKKLSAPHGVPLLEGTPLISKADLLGHILTTHFATHLGQLSSWRRLAGLPPLF